MWGEEQAAACLVGGVSAVGGGCYFCRRMLPTEEQTWDDQHVGIQIGNGSKSWNEGSGILEATHTSRDRENLPVTTPQPRRPPGRGLYDY